METKTRQTMLSQAKAYLTKSSKPLFVTGDGFYYKIETFEREGKLYYATIFFGNGKVIISVNEAVSERQYAYAGNNTLSILKQGLFPTYYKAKSIPYFKKMRGMVAEMMTEISVDNTINSKLADKYKGRLIELEPIK